MNRLQSAAIALAFALASFAVAEDNPDAAFYKKAAEGGMAEVELGKLAQDKSSTASVTEFAAMMVKEAVNKAFEMPLAEGLAFERRAFHAMFATHDQKEGMAAFSAKRKPAFKDE